MASTQRQGTVAAFNMLVRNNCAYLADEVGMGKTYVALGVLSLIRYFNPHARVLVIAPRQNIQQKWTKELKNFVRHNWKIRGNRVKSLDSTPVWEPVECQNLAELAHEALTNQDRDFFLRMTSFSLSTKDPKDRERGQHRLVEAIPWLHPCDIDTSSKDRYLESYSVALNGALPSFDLVIVDEAHNLRRGFGQKVSNRNRVIGLALGHKSGLVHNKGWFRSVVQRVLLLSATPFENDYIDIFRQLEVFGFDQVNLRDAKLQDHPLNVRILTNQEESVSRKKTILKRLLIRRTSHILINGKTFTKNMYRREWRQGGVRVFDEPIQIEDPKTRLVIALMQKKVSEILQTTKFNNSFQIGMLSSFESFSRDVRTATRRLIDSTNSDNEDGNTFDDTEQQLHLSKEERDGIDSSAIAEIAKSYYDQFDVELPHPKLDRVVESLDSVFDTGEKTLVFVRRVATINELASRLNERFNVWIKLRMESFLPHLHLEIQQLFERFQSEFRHYRLERETDLKREQAVDTLGIDSVNKDSAQHEEIEFDIDRGGVSSFFAWYFRGDGPNQILSGTAFQRNRLSSAASTLATFFEDNHVAKLLQIEPSRVIECLSTTIDLSYEESEKRLRSLAYSYFNKQRSQQSGYPRLYVFESYQVAALILLSNLKTGQNLSEYARIVLRERYAGYLDSEDCEVPQNFPAPRNSLQTSTLFTEIRRRPRLYSELWPEENINNNVEESFRRHEQRRELLTSVARLGATYIDLYLTAMKGFNSFELKSSGNEHDQDSASNFLAEKFTDLLEQQRNENGFHAYYELSCVSKTFDTLIAVNFPDIEQYSLPGLTKYFGSILGHQVPIGETSGQVNKRLVGQFRMPGFPLVLISTDVLQEGEDLHTYCKRVMHYGLAWTPSSVEQRTGRVDRIGGLMQRSLDGLPRDPLDDELIQVFFPHLRDTVELLQVQRVLSRLNLFMKLMHTKVHNPRVESALNANDAVHEEQNDLSQNKVALKSAFEIEPTWLLGNLDNNAISPTDSSDNLHYFKSLIEDLKVRYSLEMESQSQHVYHGRATFSAPMYIHSLKSSRSLPAVQEFTIRLSSHVAGEEVLISIESPLLEVDLHDEYNMNEISDVIRKMNLIKLCMEPRFKRHTDRIFVKQEMLFDLTSTTLDTLVHLFERVVLQAAYLKKRIPTCLESTR